MSKYNSEPPLWFLDINGKRIELDTDHLYNQNMFQKACVDKINVLPPTLRKQDWEQMLNALLKEMVESEQIHEATDDSIVDWLAIDEPDESTGDSTIIRKTSETDTIEAAPLVSVPAPARKEFESVAEEAADIIRRHKEMKAQLQVIQHAK